MIFDHACYRLVVHRFCCLLHFHLVAMTGMNTVLEPLGTGQARTMVSIVAYLSSVLPEASGM